VKRSGAPAYLALNKADAASADAVERARERCAKAVEFVSVHKISAKDGPGVDELLRAVAARLPEQPPYYPPGQLTDRYERFFVAECVREAIFESYGEELPYSCAVEVDRFVENQGREPDLVRLTVYVERDSQKGILIGKKGRALGELTDKSERAAAKVLGRPIRIELWVKVLPKWRDDPASLRRFGY
jgi:GTP-binding protein Era